LPASGVGHPRSIEARMTTLIIGILLLLLALFGTSLFVIIGAVALLAFYFADINTSSIIIELYRLSKQPVLLAIPLFTFAGYLLAESNTPKRLVNLSRAFFGWIPGGLAIVTLVSCAIFTAFTGASGVTIIALGGLLYPVLQAEKYPEKFNLGILTASGNLGLLFPPSLPIILYGLVSRTSIDKLFLAGVIPTILMVGMLSVYSVLSMRKVHTDIEPFSWGRTFIAVKEAAWEIPLPFIVIGGIYLGFFTATEAAAVTAFYVLIVEVFIYRDIDLKKGLPKVIRDSMVLVGGILVILSTALGLANYMIDAEIPMKILGWMQTFISSKLAFLLVLNIFLLVVGALMDIFSAIMVVVPLIIPIAGEFGIHPVHLGIIFLANLGIGYSTPPVGMNLFIASFRFNKPVLKLYVATIPFLIILLIALLLITYIPDLSLWLVE
jgi:C4-dicarboxylate transporter DctM subunit